MSTRTKIDLIAGLLGGATAFGLYLIYLNIVEERTWASIMYVLCR